MIRLVVIVQDYWDKEFFEAQSDFLRSYDIKILAYGDTSADAFAFYAQFKPNLLLMPFWMPGKSALTVARRIKRHYRDAHFLVTMNKLVPFFAKLIFDENLSSL